MFAPSVAATSPVIEPLAVAHGHIAVIAAQQHLGTRRDHLAAFVQTGVDRGLGAAGAHRLDLGDGIGHLQQALGAGEQMGQKVGAQTEAEHRDVLLVHQIAQIVDLLRGQELALVGDDDIMLTRRPVQLQQAVLRADDLGLLLQADAGADQGDAVPGVGGRLDEPDRHIEFLVIELGDEGLGRFGAAHGAVFEVELGHLLVLFGQLAQEVDGKGQAGQEGQTVGPRLGQGHAGYPFVLWYRN